MSAPAALAVSTPTPGTTDSGPDVAALPRAQRTLTVRVDATRRAAESVTAFELRAVDGGSLPAWEPGAHLDVHLPSGLVRQYSLCGDPRDLASYRIAVLADAGGRGGSLEVHRELRAGERLEIGLPRNNFPLVDSDRYVFVAGGIGITPMLAMARQAARDGKDWRLVYGARTAEHFAFASELLSLEGAAERVSLIANDTDGNADLGALVSDSHGAQVYCCGPPGLMGALTALMEGAGRSQDLHLELFSPLAAPPAAQEGDAPAGGFTLTLAASGLQVEVGAEETALAAIRRAGVEHPSSCEMGFCGTCEVRVVEGEVDHRDDLYTESERQSGGCMLVCVSRAKGCALTIQA